MLTKHILEFNIFCSCKYSYAGFAKARRETVLRGMPGLKCSKISQKMPAGPICSQFLLLLRFVCFERNNKENVARNWWTKLTSMVMGTSTMKNLSRWCLRWSEFQHLAYLCLWAKFVNLNSLHNIINTPWWLLTIVSCQSEVCIDQNWFPVSQRSQAAAERADHKI